MKFRIENCECEFELPESQVRASDSKNPYLHIDYIALGEIARQYIQCRMPDAVTRVTCGGYSGGSTVTVKIDPSTVDDAQVRDLRRLLELFEEGVFDPLQDTYRYRSTSGFSTTDGMPIQRSVKYTFVQLNLG